LVRTSSPGVFYDKMRLDADLVRYLTTADIRVLVALEARMRTNELVPKDQLRGVCKNGEGELKMVLRTLGKQSLTHQEQGFFRLTYHGQDAIALKELHQKQRIISGIGYQMGCGKESDLFGCQAANGDDCILKLHRLGRTSFRKGVKNQRDYIKNYKYNINWLTMSHLSATSEAKFMNMLGEAKFRVPKFYGVNRHAIVMGFVPGKPLSHTKRGDIEKPEDVFNECLSMIVQLAEFGYIHGDFNEFNLMIAKESDLINCTGVIPTVEDELRYEAIHNGVETLTNNDAEKIIMIDFPQLVPIDHPNGKELFDRDISGVVDYFKEYNISNVELPKYEDIYKGIIQLETSESEEGYDSESEDVKYSD